MSGNPVSNMSSPIGRVELVEKGFLSHSMRNTTQVLVIIKGLEEVKV
jgi:hypothetical protein